jgi:hypothetical protein
MNEVHTFGPYDEQYPQMEEIYAELYRLFGLMNGIVYVPNTKFVLHEIEGEEQVFHLCHYG